jgi:hypothetical protein
LIVIYPSVFNVTFHGFLSVVGADVLIIDWELVDIVIR